MLAAHAAGLLPAGATVAEGATPHGGSWRTELERLGLRWAGRRRSRPTSWSTRSFGMMHAVDQAAALDALIARLAPDGTLLFGFHSLAAILREQQWNAVRLGHYAYYSVPVLRRMLAERGLTVVNAWQFPLYGGTVLLAARRDGTPDPVGRRDRRGRAGRRCAATRQAVQKLQERVDGSIAALRRLTADAAAAGRSVYGYSAASRAVVADLPGRARTPDRLRGVADASPGKHGLPDARHDDPGAHPGRAGRRPPRRGAAVRLRPDARGARGRCPRSRRPVVAGSTSDPAHRRPAERVGSGRS